MKIYKNSNLTEEIDDTFNLGVVQAGDTKEYEFYVYNDTVAELVELSFIIDNSEASVVSAPTKLGAKEIGTLKIKYSPSVDLRKGLKTSLKYKGVEIYY